MWVRYDVYGRGERTLYIRFRVPKVRLEEHTYQMIAANIRESLSPLPQNIVFIASKDRMGQEVDKVSLSPDDIMWIHPYGAPIIHGAGSSQHTLCRDIIPDYE